MADDWQYAPGWPGAEARWTSSAKSGVGSALSSESRVWFTLSHGILNEVYYPRIDQACMRDMGLIVTDGKDFFSEEKRHTTHEVEYEAPGVPAFRLVNTSSDNRYRIEKQVIADPERDAILQRVRFTPLTGNLEDYHLYALISPHLGNQGAGNTAWVDEHKGVTMLFAERNGLCLALACSVPWLKCSVGFVGTSDGWQDLSQHKQMEWNYTRAENGNVAMTGEIDLMSQNGEFTLALGFGLTAAEAGYRALAGLIESFEVLHPKYIHEWLDWHSTVNELGPTPTKGGKDVYRVSATVLRVHEAKNFRGGMIASLSIPWGESKGDSDLGGYHLVWPRDLAETAGGLLAAGASDDALRVLHYLQTAQEANGHWSQNMWMDTTPYWNAVQMDETALPILLVNMARRRGVLDAQGAESFYQMVRRAASCLVRFGPVTEEDRWEEDAGYTPFTLAAEICALLVAADMADEQGEHGIARYLRETADAWNSSIERWTYARGTDLAKQYGVDGYYIRIAPPQGVSAGLPMRGLVQIKNRAGGASVQPATSVVSTDALALVRFGLRAADDPHIVNTVKVIDAMLKVETPHGTTWHRYNEDGYGEHEDGSPYDGTGIGRGWPLLTGERAHYELAAGRRNIAEKLLRDMESFSNDGGLIPEQVWDTADIPERDLFCGVFSGSAMPLVWAHAEYIKLRRSLKDGKIFDMPDQTVERYLKKQTRSPHSVWRFNNKIRTMPEGKTLRIETVHPSRLHWSADDWQTSNDIDTHDTGLGIYIADLPTEGLKEGKKISFTILWTTNNRWEGTNYEVKVSQATPTH